MQRALCFSPLLAYYVNQNLLEGLWVEGSDNTAQYCVLGPHVQPGNEDRVSFSPSALSLHDSLHLLSIEQILNSL